tara:strand:- start:2927 stop:3097 length:171 start_codon:yes stop_codon:yes gene_type:complete
MVTKKKKWEVNVLSKINHKLQWTKFVHSCIDPSTAVKQAYAKYPELTTILINLNTE